MMSKCILTSIKSDHEELVNGFVKFDFKIGFNIYTDDFQITFFKKLGCLDSSIYVSSDKLSFCTSVGTFIYKKKSGISAYKQVLQDFKLNKSINEIRSNSIGMFTLYFYFSNKLFVISDAEASHFTYYYYKNGRFISTQTYYHVAKLIKPKVDDQALNEATFLSGFIGEQSPFQDILKLQTHKSLVFKDGNFVITNNQSNRLNKTKNYSQSLNHVVDAYRLNFASPAISMTGGIDSRTVLAFYLNNGMKPTLLHGQGNSYLTNTHKEDFELVKLISKNNNLRYKLLDFSDSVPYSDNWQENLEKYGELYHIYGANENYISSYINQSHDLIHFGLIGERLRQNFTIEHSKKFTIKNIIESMFNPKSMPKYIYSENIFKKSMIVKLKATIGDSTLSISEIDYYKRQNRDTQLMNLFNLYVASDNFFTSNYMTSNYVRKISPDERVNAKFQIQLIKENYSDLLDIPFFSHQRFVTFNEKEKISTTSKIKRTVKKIPGVMLFIRKIINITRRNKYNNQDLRIFLEKKWKNQTGRDIPHGDVRYYFRWLQYNYLINQVNK